MTKIFSVQKFSYIHYVLLTPNTAGPVLSNFTLLHFALFNFRRKLNVNLLH